MDKLVGMAVLVLIAVSIWAVMPSQPTVVVTDTADGRSPAATSAEAGDAIPVGSSRTKTGVSESGEGKTRKTSVTSGIAPSAPMRPRLPGKNELPDMVDGEPINARVFSENPVAEQAKKDTPVDDTPMGPFANVHWDGETDYADLEGDLMKIYAQRDGDGRLPKNLVASQVLRASVLQDLNVTATTPVVMIGDHHPVHQDAITETLKRARKGQFLTGFTFADPNSTSDGRRVYVKVLQD
jgi:hypothetical protein